MVPSLLNEVQAIIPITLTLNVKGTRSRDREMSNSDSSHDQRICHGTWNDRVLLWCLTCQTKMKQSSIKIPSSAE